MLVTSCCRVSARYALAVSPARVVKRSRRTAGIAALATFGREKTVQARAPIAAAPTKPAAILGLAHRTRVRLSAFNAPE